jgi:hypothetical protein
MRLKLLSFAIKSRRNCASRKCQNSGAPIIGQDRHHAGSLLGRGSASYPGPVDAGVGAPDLTCVFAQGHGTRKLTACAPLAPGAGQPHDGVEVDHSPGSTIAFHASISFSKSALRNGDLFRHNGHTTPSSSTSGRLPQRLHLMTAIGSRPSLKSYQMQVSSWISTHSNSESGPAAPTAFPHSAHTYVDTFVKPGNVFTLPQCGHEVVAHSSPSRPFKISRWTTPTTASHSLQRSSTLLPSTAAMMQPQHSTPAVSCGTMGIRLVRSWLRSASMLHSYHSLHCLPSWTGTVHFPRSPYSRPLIARHWFRPFL